MNEDFELYDAMITKIYVDGKENEELPSPNDYSYEKGICSNDATIDYVYNEYREQWELNIEFTKTGKAIPADCELYFVSKAAADGNGNGDDANNGNNPNNDFNNNNGGNNFNNDFGNNNNGYESSNNIYGNNSSNNNGFVNINEIGYGFSAK